MQQSDQIQNYPLQIFVALYHCGEKEKK